MLKHSSPSRNHFQRPKSVKLKVNLVFRMFLVVVIGVWMVYQLRLFPAHKLQPGETNDADAASQHRHMNLGLGRRGGFLIKEARVVTRSSNEEAKSDDDTRRTDEIMEPLDEGEALEITEPLDDDPLELEETDFQNDDDDDSDDDQKANTIEMKTGGDDDGDSSKRMPSTID